VTSAISLIGSWFVAATSGAIAAWILGFVRDHWNRPLLDVEINNDLGSIVETETTDRLTRQKYARLVVRNNGRTMAHNCCASIDYLKRTDQPARILFFEPI
jgi:hypothetical protein